MSTLTVWRFNTPDGAEKADYPVLALGDDETAVLQATTGGYPLYIVEAARRALEESVASIKEIAKALGELAQKARSGQTAIEEISAKGDQLQRDAAQSIAAVDRISNTIDAALCQRLSRSIATTSSWVASSPPGRSNSCPPRVARKSTWSLRKEKPVGALT